MSISTTDVRKAFGSAPAVDGVSLDIAAGEFFVVLGPSGCGKTTLLRLIAGLETLDAGRIALAGRDVAGAGLHVPPEDRGVGVVFQSYALWPHMTVQANVAFPMQTAGLAASTVRERAGRCLATVELSAFAERRPAELSGGQRQRVALARCLAQRAGTILMDEPLANLDPHLRGTMEEELAAFHRAAAATTLYITHDQREAMALADRVAIMWDGRILQADTPETVYHRPADERVARFVGRSAVLAGSIARVEGGRAVVSLAGRTVDAWGPPGLQTGGAVRVVVRPDDVGPTSDGGFAARIDRVTYRGGLWEAHAAVEGLDEPLVMNLRDRITTGERLAVAIRRAWVLPAAA